MNSLRLNFVVKHFSRLLLHKVDEPWASCRIPKSLLHSTNNKSFFLKMSWYWTSSIITIQIGKFNLIHVPARINSLLRLFKALAKNKNNCCYIRQKEWYITFPSPVVYQFLCTRGLGIIQDSLLNIFTFFIWWFTCLLSDFFCKI